MHARPDIGLSHYSYSDLSSCQRATRLLSRLKRGLKEEMQVTNDVVCTLPTLSSFVSEEVHLPRNGLTIHSEYTTLTGSEEVK